MRRLQRSSLVLLWEIFALLSCALCEQGEYPWIYYCERPDFPQIHCAFADSEGGVIVSTGDWWNYWWDHQSYWSRGVFRLAGGRLQALNSPPCSFVLDGAIDADSRTWLLIAEGMTEYDIASSDRDSGLPNRGYDTGYRYFRWPSRGFNMGDYRFAVMEGGQLVEQPELSNVIPADPVLMASDPDGRIYVMSQELNGNVVERSLIS